MNTNCSKCKAPMPAPKPIRDASPFGRMPLRITGYRCDKCGQWNNLKTRKGWVK